MGQAWLDRLEHSWDFEPVKLGRSCSLRLVLETRCTSISPSQASR